MDIVKARFIKSTTNLSQKPNGKLAEFAFIGRSNVGKSSLINSLCRRRNLAKVSCTPGKTSLINYFRVLLKITELKCQELFLIDLPGYGYSKTSKTNKKIWSFYINDFIVNSQQLRSVFLLVDSRLEPQILDLEAIHWLKELKKDIYIVVTKIDKISRGKTGNLIGKFKDNFNINNVILYSAANGVGRNELIASIHQKM